MIVITNKKKHPVQLIVRSKRGPHAFTVLNIPGVGKGNNTRTIQDEQHTEYVDRVESLGLIDQKTVANEVN